MLTADEDLVTRFDGAGRLRSATVDRHAGSVTKFLGQGATGTKATGFEENIETHGIVPSFEFRVSGSPNSKLETRNLVLRSREDPEQFTLLLFGLYASS